MRFRRATPHHQNSEMAEEIRPISSFLHCEPISFAALGRHMAPRELQASACHYNVVPRAVEAHQASVAARLRLPASDICWFQQWPFSGFDPPLSFSASTSPSCPPSAAPCVPVLCETETRGRQPLLKTRSTRGAWLPTILLSSLL